VFSFECGLKKRTFFRQTEDFKRLAKERYKVEAKNSELKNGHGYDTATARVYLACKFKEQ